MPVFQPVPLHEMLDFHTHQLAPHTRAAACARLSVVAHSTALPRRRLFAESDQPVSLPAPGTPQQDSGTPAKQDKPATAHPSRTPAGLIHDTGHHQLGPTTQIHVYWDLDNLHPNPCPPDVAVDGLKALLRPYGRVKAVTGYGNTHTLRVMECPKPVYLQGVPDPTAPPAPQKPQQTHVTPGDLYRCQFCGRRCKSAEELKKHFKQLHEREFQKKLAHKPLAKKVLANKEYMERYRDARDAACVRPWDFTLGRWLRPGLRHAGVKVVEVKMQKEAVDRKLISDAKLLVTNRGPSADEPVQDSTVHKALCIVSSDRGFADLATLARAHGWDVIAVCGANKIRQGYPKAGVTLAFEFAQAVGLEVDEGWTGMTVQERYAMLLESDGQRRSVAGTRGL